MIIGINMPVLLIMSVPESCQMLVNEIVLNVYTLVSFYTLIID